MDWSKRQPSTKESARSKDRHDGFSAGFIDHS